MNKIFFIVFAVFFNFLFINKITAQDKYATVFIYRPSMAYGSMPSHYIKINNREVATLKNGGYLEYRVYNDKNIEIAANAKSMGMSSTSWTKLNLSVEDGKKYYVRVYPKMMTVGLEVLESPIDDKKLKKDRYVIKNDLGVGNELTEWNKQKIENFWIENGIEGLEGFYQRVGGTNDYTLALFNHNNEYNFIYLNGDELDFAEGMIKAKLKKTSNYGTFMATWFLGNKAEDLIVKISDNMFKIVFSNGKEHTFIKIYPTYESNIKNKI